jgi:hypothetical protein
MLRQREKRAQHNRPEVSAGWWNETSTHGTLSVFLQRHFFCEILLPEHGAQHMDAAVISIVAEINCDETV